MAEEMSLDPSAPGAMVRYRQTLTLSLFYKFYLTVLQKLRLQVCLIEFNFFHLMKVKPDSLLRFVVLSGSECSGG